MSNFVKTFSLLSIVCALGIPSVWAYTDMPIENGGIIVGQVTIEGPKPDPLAYNLALFPDPAFADKFPQEPAGGCMNLFKFLLMELCKMLS